MELGPKSGLNVLVSCALGSWRCWWHRGSWSTGVCWETSVCICTGGNWRWEDPAPAAGQAECLWAATGGIHSVLIHIYTFFFPSLISVHPDQGARGRGQGCWCCICSDESWVLLHWSMWLDACNYVCTWCIHTCVCMCAYWEHILSHAMGQTWGSGAVVASPLSGCRIWDPPNQTPLTLLEWPCRVLQPLTFGLGPK